MQFERTTRLWLDFPFSLRRVFGSTYLRMQLLGRIVLAEVPEEVPNEIEENEVERNGEVDSEVPQRMILCDGQRGRREGIVGGRRHGVDGESVLRGDVTLASVGEDRVLEGGDVRAREGSKGKKSLLDRPSPCQNRERSESVSKHIIEDLIEVRSNLQTAIHHRSARGAFAQRIMRLAMAATTLHDAAER